MKNYFSKYKLVIFDLDNTLILENDYLFKAYEDIAYHIGSIHFLDKINIENYLKSEFVKNGRSKLFDKMISHFNISEVEMTSILDILRGVKLLNKICLIENMKQILKFLKSNKIPYVIFTNGNVAQQKNKIANIQWDGLLTDVIYANEISPKPNPISFSKHLLKHEIKINMQKILMIGDSHVDELFAKNIGCDYEHVSYFTKKVI